jgi:hypothetical protein
MAATSPFTSAGTLIAIAVDSEPSPYNATQFALETWVLVGEISDAGDFGREYALVTFNPLADRRTVKRKGSYNDGQMTLQLARVPSDAGQADLIQALASDQNSGFRVTLQDGTKLYFTAQVLSYTTNVGTTDQITGATAMVEITGDIIEVPSP